MEIITYNYINVKLRFMCVTITDHMRNIDVINVAGLLLDGKNDGLEAAIRHNLKPRSIITIAPTPPRSARENPNYSIERAMAMVKEITEDLRRGNPTAKVILIGRSYGGFIALLVACRMNFENILKVITIESPLHPEVAVGPPMLLPPLALCGPHYQHRASLAREAIEFLKQHGTERVLTIQTGREDGVVPPEAQILQDMSPHKGLRVRLPSHLGHGDPGLLQMALPPSYRNHLFWSEEKMKYIMSIINDVARPLGD